MVEGTLWGLCPGVGSTGTPWCLLASPHLCCPVPRAQDPQQRVACSRRPQGGGQAPGKMLPAAFPERSPYLLPAAFLPGRQTPTLAWSHLLFMGPQADPSPLGTQLANPLAVGQGCRAIPALLSVLLCPRAMGAPSLAPSDGLLCMDPFGGGSPSPVRWVYLSAFLGAAAARLHGALGK